jgi:radical SAM/Cys-rich protein
MGRVLPTLHKTHDPLADPRLQLETLARVAPRPTFGESLANASLFPLRPTGIDTLQINVGKKCNQTCQHCHVDAGPDRTEVMSRDVVEACLRTLGSSDIKTLDITGGAPELHPDFREIVTRARELDRKVMDRCNLTVLLLPNYSDLPAFFAENSVEIVCSLPHYREKQTDSQRGEGVFAESLEALHRLNDLGYGRPGSGLEIHLVTNPVGAFLPGSQAELERDWKRQLDDRYGITFNRLYTITNMPISRYLHWLEESGKLEAYMQRLIDAFNPVAAADVMCRNTLSVGWDGTLYDCDFNQMLNIPVESKISTSILDFDATQLGDRSIQVGPHCFGCTAGAGSSCGGAIT